MAKSKVNSGGHEELRQKKRSGLAICGVVSFLLSRHHTIHFYLFSVAMEILVAALQGICSLGGRLHKRPAIFSFVDLVIDLVFCRPARRE